MSETPLFRLLGSEPAQEYLRIDPCGRFFVKGVEVETNEEVRDAFLTFITSFGRAYEHANLRAELERRDAVIVQAHTALANGFSSSARIALAQELALTGKGRAA